MAKELSREEKADIRVLARFIAIFCREKHEAAREVYSLENMNISDARNRAVLLCPQCTSLLRYGITMRLRCPRDPKPMCRKCETQCYRREYKEQMREVMKFSGMYLVRRGRIDLLFHYFK